MGSIDKRIKEIMQMGNKDISKYEKEIFSLKIEYKQAKEKALNNLNNLNTPINWFPQSASLSKNAKGFLNIQNNLVPCKQIDSANIINTLDDVINKIYSLNNLFHILREVTNLEKNKYFERLTEDYFNFCSYYNTILTIYNNLDSNLEKKIDEINSRINLVIEKANKDLKNKSKQINNLKIELDSYLESNNKYLLCENDISYDNKELSKFVLGLKCEQLSNESKEFLKNNFNYTQNDFLSLSSSPKLLDLNNDGGSILIKTSTSNMSCSSINEIIENIILSYIKALGAKKVKLCGFESNYNTRLTSVINEFISNNDYFSYNKIGVVKKDNDIEKLLDFLVNEINDREINYSNNGYTNIYDYNMNNNDNEHETILLFINDYPSSLENRISNAEVIKKINYILSKGKDMGVYITALEDEDDSSYDNDNYRDSINKLNEELFSVVLSNLNFKDKSYYCDLDKLTYSIRDNSFNLKNYLLSLSKKQKDENRFYLSKLLDEIKRKNIKYESNKSEIKIPVGRINNEIYDFITDSSSSPSALVLGGSGSGKSSFLHTLILSAASIYTPDELEFYVADFKNTDKTIDGPTFTVYQKDGEYYIPHIKYMSTIGSIENTKDILDVIDTLKNKRAKLFRQINGCQDIVGYNNSPQVKKGQLPRMSRIIFIIDEFNHMFGDKETSPELEVIKADIKRMLKNALTTIRAFGICILFSGQENSLDSTSSSQINTKILLKDAKHNFAISEKHLKATNTKGNSIFISNGNNELVKLVYTGDFSSDVISDVEEKRKIVKNIQEKYKDKEYIQKYARDNKEVGISKETNLFSLIEEDRLDFEALNGYTVYLGRSYGLDEPASIYFSTQSDTQYNVVAPLTQLSKIERNIMLGFLTTTLVLNKNKANKSISYCKIEDNESDSANCLDDFIDKYDELNDYFDILTNPINIARKINTLYEEYMNRESRISRSREPLLLVVNNIKRLKEKISNLKNTTRVNTPKLSPEKEAIRQRLLKQQEQGKDVSFLLEQLENSTGNFASDNDYNDIKANDVIDKLKYLIENGRRYSVFVIVTGNNKDSFKDYIKQNKFTITNSNLSDIRNTCCSVNCERPQKIFRNGLETIETDQPFSINIKLYNYSLKNESEFWNNLMNIIKNN